MKGHIEIIRRESSDCELSLVYVDAQHNLFTDSSVVRKDLLKWVQREEQEEAAAVRDCGPQTHIHA